MSSAPATTTKTPVLNRCEPQRNIHMDRPCQVYGSYKCKSLLDLVQQIQLAIQDTVAGTAPARPASHTSSHYAQYISQTLLSNQYLSTACINSCST
jgi:hypothetical protein